MLSPESAIFPSDLHCVFPYPTKVNITSRSTLILHGEVVVTSLQLDGALKLSAESGAMLLMKGKSLIKNKGYELKQLSPAEMEKASVIINNYLTPPHGPNLPYSNVPYPTLTYSKVPKRTLTYPNPFPSPNLALT